MLLNRHYESCIFAEYEPPALNRLKSVVVVPVVTADRLPPQFNVVRKPTLLTRSAARHF